VYWPEELALVSKFLTDEEFAELLERLVRVLPDGPFVDRGEVFGEPMRN
jgi:hypothetical protein